MHYAELVSTQVKQMYLRTFQNLTPLEDDNTSLCSSSSSIDIDSCVVLAPNLPVRSLSAFLRTTIPPSKLPTKNAKSSGKVLTSLENMRLMEAKEAAKKEKARIAERKKAREQKAKEKANKSGMYCKF